MSLKKIFIFVGVIFVIGFILHFVYLYYFPSLFDGMVSQKIVTQLDNVTEKIGQQVSLLKDKMHKKIARLYQTRDIKDEIGKEILALMTTKLSTTQDKLKMEVGEQLRRLALRLDSVDCAQKSLENFSDTIGIQLADMKDVGLKEFVGVSKKSEQNAVRINQVSNELSNVIGKQSKTNKKNEETSQDLRALYEQACIFDEQAKETFEKHIKKALEVKEDLMDARSKVGSLQKKLEVLSSMQGSISKNEERFRKVDNNIAMINPLDKKIGQTETQIRQMNQKIKELAKLEDLLVLEEKTRMDSEQNMINVFDSKLASTEDRMKTYVNEEVSRMALDAVQNDEKTTIESESIAKKREHDFKVLSNELYDHIDICMKEKGEALNEATLIASENNKEQLREEINLISSQQDKRVNELVVNQIEQSLPPTEIQEKRGGQNREESQVDVDSVIKKEVRKQLAKIKYAKDIRSKNLKKIVAQKKMKKLLSTFLNNDLEDIDF